MTDHEKLSRTLIRTWRGERSQRALSHALGFRSSVVGHWESGRNQCATSVGLRMAELATPGTLDALCAFVRADWAQHLSPATPAGVARLMNDLIQSRDPSDVAQRIGLSRDRVGRWLRASIEPNLSQFLAYLDALSIWPIVVPLLAPSVRFIGAMPRLLSTRAREVMAALELRGYRELPRHDPSWIARQSGSTLSQVRRALDELKLHALIAWSGTHWLGQPEPFRDVDDPPPGPRPLEARVRRLLHEGKHERHHVALCAVHEQGLEKLHAVLFEARNQIADIVKETQAPGDQLVYISLALLMLRDQAPLRD